MHATLSTLFTRAVGRGLATFAAILAGAWIAQAILDSPLHLIVDMLGGGAIAVAAAALTLHCFDQPRWPSAGHMLSITTLTPPPTEDELRAIRRRFGLPEE